ncbi:MAG: cysteine desulfurase [Gemmataceae bacterium]|nr:cysteine desulfurase [Gemmataceae bacterium]
MRPLYLDHASTTPLRPEAAAAMAAAWAAVGNPASAHRWGRQARTLLEDARERVAGLLGASPDEVVFTGGATEANNLAVFGLANSVGGPTVREGGWQKPSLTVGPPTGSVLASPVEHPCVVEPVKQLGAVDWLPVSARGVVRADAVAGLIRPDTRLVTVMLANHETGAIQPVGEVVKAVPAGVPVHTDAAQTVGKMPVHFRELGVAALTASAHKFGGPVGAGLLVLKRGTPFRPLFFGGHQQAGRRPGTESVPLAVGLAAALERAVHDMAADQTKLGAWKARFWERLREVASPVVVNGPEPGSADGLPHILNVSFPGCRADLLVAALDLAGVACSAGAACSSGSLLPSPVLRAMGLPDEVVRSAVRFSFGPGLDFADTDDAADRVGSAVRRQRG